MDTPAGASAKSSDPTSGAWIAGLIVTGLLALGIGTLWGLAHGGHDTRVVSPASNAAVQPACQRWAESLRVDAPEGSWCSGMADWMGSHVAGMMGSGVDSGAWQDVCLSWMQRQGRGQSADDACTSIAMWMMIDGSDQGNVDMMPGH